MMSAIKFDGILNKITTTIDGGWNVTFSVSQNDTEELMRLSEFRSEALSVVVLTAAMIAENREDNANERWEGA
jgi:hypothetical protein